MWHGVQAKHLLVTRQAPNHWATAPVLFYLYSATYKMAARHLHNNSSDYQYKIQWGTGQILVWWCSSNLFPYVGWLPRISLQLYDVSVVSSLICCMCACIYTCVTIHISRIMHIRTVYETWHVHLCNSTSQSSYKHWRETNTNYTWHMVYSL